MKKCQLKKINRKETSIKLFLLHQMKSCCSIGCSIAIRECKIEFTNHRTELCSALAGSGVGCGSLVCQACAFRSVHHVGITVQALGHFIANDVDQTLENRLR